MAKVGLYLVALLGLSSVIVAGEDFQFFRLEDDSAEIFARDTVDDCPSSSSDCAGPVENGTEYCMLLSHECVPSFSEIPFPTEGEPDDVDGSGFFFLFETNGVILANFMDGEYGIVEMKFRYYTNVPEVPPPQSNNIETLEDDGYHGFRKSTPGFWSERSFRVRNPSSVAHFNINLVGPGSGYYFIIDKIVVAFDENINPEDPDPTTEQEETTTELPTTEEPERTTLTPGPDPTTTDPSATPGPDPTTTDPSATPGPDPTTDPSATPGPDPTTTDPWATPTTLGPISTPESTTPEDGATDPPSTTAGPDDDDSGLAGWAIALISIGTVGLVGAAAAGGYYYYKHRGVGGEHAKLKEDFDWENNAGQENPDFNDNPATYAESVPAASVYNYDAPASAMYTGEAPQPGQILPRLKKII